MMDREPVEDAGAVRSQGRAGRRVLLLVAGLAVVAGIYLVAERGRSRGGREEQAGEVAASGGPVAVAAVVPVPDDAPVARVVEWVEDEQLGGIAALTILIPGAVSEGDILRVRRHGEFLCRIRVQGVAAEDAVGNVIGTPPKPPLNADDVLSVDRSGR